MPDEEHLHIDQAAELRYYLAVDTQHITKKIDTEKALDKVKSKTKLETCPGGDGHNALRPSCPFPS